jgi:hypothetical protein
MLPTPIVQLPPPYQTATANAPGAESVKHFNKVESLAAGGWFDRMCLRVDSLLGATTEKREYPIPLLTLPALTAEGSSDGGSVLVNGSVYLTPFFKAAPYASPWALFFRAKFPAPVTAKHALVEVYASATGYNAQVGCNYDDSVTARTQLYSKTSGSGGSTASSFGWTIDPTQPHDFAIAFDGVNVKFDTDGTVWSQSAPTNTQFPLGPVKVLANATSGFGLEIMRIGYAF